MTFFVSEHEVSAKKIVGIAPLRGPNGQLVSPEIGLQILLEQDGETTKWLCESGSPAPSVGDFFVTDAELGVSFIFPAARFHELFHAEE